MTTTRRYALRDHKLRAVRYANETDCAYTRFVRSARAAARIARLAADLNVAVPTLKAVIREVQAEQLRHRATRIAARMRAEEAGR